MDTSGIKYFLGQHESTVLNALDKMRRDNVVPRIWVSDYTLWKPKPDDITNRLGWLNAPAETLEKLPAVKSALAQFVGSDIQDVVLLGMGGSSLGAEVFSKIFGSPAGIPRLHIVDTTDPPAISAIAASLNLEKAVFLVSSKSGTTLEITSLFHFFYNLVKNKLGNSVGDHFIFITDEGSSMIEQALRLRLPHVFLNNPAIGGRYSVLSLPGIVPAAIIGVDIEKLLQNAQAQVLREKAPIHPGKLDETGVVLGATLGTLAQNGRNKLTLILPEGLRSLGDWLEQLIAESTGKEGKGILPVLNEPPTPMEAYGQDRVFVIFQNGKDDHDSEATALITAGHPVILIRLNDIYDVGAQMFCWEMATAVASHILGINPFDQPDVEATKIHTRTMISQYRKNKELPAQSPSLITPECRIYSSIKSTSPTEALQKFLGQATDGDYACLQIYLSPSPEINKALTGLRKAIGGKYRLPVTFGYGPRYLHSTGQLHKGDAGHGLFIQLTADDALDIDIPDDIGKDASSLTFGTLKAAQALGDWQALQGAKRRIIRFHWKANPASGLTELAKLL